MRSRVIRPNYRLSEAIAASIWGLLGFLLLLGAVWPFFDPLPALADVGGDRLAVTGLLLVLAASLNLITEAPLRYETTKWRLLIGSDMARILGLCTLSYMALLSNPTAIGWAVIGGGFSVAAGARMWTLWKFLRKVHQLRRQDARSV